MLKPIVIVAAVLATVGVGWPLASSIAGGGQNEATRLVQAADRTQTKAQSLSRSYNDVIPPPEPLSAPQGDPQPPRQIGSGEARSNFRCNCHSGSHANSQRARGKGCHRFPEPCTTGPGTRKH